MVGIILAIFCIVFALVLIWLKLWDIDSRLEIISMVLQRITDEDRKEQE